MTTTDRDRNLMLFLPALLIVTFYILYFGRSKHTVLKSTRDGVASTQKRVPSDSQLALEQGKLRVLNQDITSDKRTLETAACCVAQAERTRRHERLTGLMAKYGLVVVEDADAETGKGARLTPRLTELSKQMAEQRGSSKPHLRRLRVHGVFPNVKKVIEDLAIAETQAMAVGLALTENKEGDKMREWVLLVWI